MEDIDKKNGMTGRRRFLITATSVAGGIARVAWATPFILSMMPSERAKAAGAPVEVDISKLEPGMLLLVEWRGKVVWILSRTPEMLATLTTLDGKLSDPNSEREQQPEYAQNLTRSIRPEILVTTGVCTHLGCVPLGDAGDFGGWFCPCHGSHYDTSGRIRKGPAPTNLPIPEYAFIDDNRIIVG